MLINYHTSLIFLVKLLFYMSETVFILYCSFVLIIFNYFFISYNVYKQHANAKQTLNDCVKDFFEVKVLLFTKTYITRLQLVHLLISFNRI